MSVVATALLWALYIALSAAGGVVIVRVGPVRQLVLQAKKPWACDVCMSLWSSLTVWLAVLTQVRTFEALIAIAPAYAITYAVLHKLGEPKGPPPSLPPLDDLG